MAFEAIVLTPVAILVVVCGIFLAHRGARPARRGRAGARLTPSAIGR